MSEKIQYEVQVVDKSSAPIAKISAETKKLGKETKSLGKAFAETFKNEVKGIGEGISKQFKSVHKGLTGIIGSVIGTIGKAIVNLIKMKLAIMAVTWILKTAGGESTKLGRFLTQALSPIGKGLLGPLIEGAKKAKNALDQMLSTSVGFKRFKLIVADLINIFRFGADTQIAFTRDFKTFGDVFDKHISKLSPLTRNIASGFAFGAQSMGNFFRQGDSVLKFFRGFTNIGSKVLGFILKFPLAILGVGAAVVTAIISLKNIGKTIKELDEELDKSVILNMSVAEFKGWDSAFRYAGTSMENMSASITRFNLEAYEAVRKGGEAAKVFKDLGISVLTTDGYMKPSNELFEEAISKLAGIKDITLRNAMALAIFGARGREIIPVLDDYNNNGKKAIEWHKRFKTQLQASAEASSRFNDFLQKIGDTMKIAWQQSAYRIIQRLNDTFEILTIGGDRYADGMVKVFDVIAETTGKIIDALNVVLGSIQGTIGFLRAGILGLLVTVAKAYTEMLAMINSIPKIGPKLVSYKMVNDSVKALEKFSDEFETVREQVEKNAELVGRSMAQMFTGVKPSVSGKPSGQERPPTSTPAKAASGGTTILCTTNNIDMGGLRDFNAARLQALDQYSELSLSIIQQAQVREMAILAVSYDKKKQDLTNSIMYGYLTEEEGADAKIALSKWYEQERLKISADGTQTYLDNLQKTKEEAIAKYQDLADGAGAALKPIGDNFFNIYDMMAKVDEQNALMYNSWSAMFEGMNNVSLSVVENFGNMYTVLNDENATYQEQLQATMAVISSLAQQSTNIMNQLAQNQSQTAQNALKEWYDAEKENISKTVKGRKNQEKALTKLDKERTEREEKLRKESAQTQQTVAVISAVINTALGITQALANLPPPASFVMAGIVATLGAVQIGMIASQKFAQGGIVSGTSRSGDNMTARVNSGEMILNQRQQAELFAIANGRAPASTITITTAPITINGNISSDTVNQLDEYSMREQQRLKTMLKELAFQGELNFIGA